MKRVTIKSAGGWNKLEIEKELEIPKPKRGEVLVKVFAAGVNFADCCVRMGLYASAKKYVGWPITPGFEFSGTVVEFGQDSTEEYESIIRIRHLHIGSEVFGVTRFFANANYVVVPKHQIFLKPTKFSFEEAAGFPAVFLTAYYGMFELAHPRKGDAILIHSAAGGVGGALVQLAKLVPNTIVVAVVGSSHKVGLAKKLGADFVIDKSKEDLWKKCEEYVPEGFQIVFDANGVETLQKSYDHLNLEGGKLVLYGFHSMLSKDSSTGTPNWFKIIWDWLWTPTFNPLNMTGQNRSVLAFNLSYLFAKVDMFTEMMEELIKLVEENKIQMCPVTTYLLEEIAEAHKAIESGQTTGKLVLMME